MTQTVAGIPKGDISIHKYQYDYKREKRFPGMHIFKGPLIDEERLAMKCAALILKKDYLALEPRCEQ